MSDKFIIKEFYEMTIYIFHLLLLCKSNYVVFRKSVGSKKRLAENLFDKFQNSNYKGVFPNSMKIPSKIL